MGLPLSMYNSEVALCGTEQIAASVCPHKYSNYSSLFVQLSGAGMYTQAVGEIQYIPLVTEML